MRLLLRLLGLLMLAGAFAAAVVDGTRSVAAGAVSILPLSETLADLSPKGFASLHVLAETKAPALWTPLLVKVLSLPTWAVLGLVGLGLLAVTRPRPPVIGYSR